MKNKWRTAFWILLAVFIVVTATLFYRVLNQAVTITYMREGYEDTENDLKQLSEIVTGKLTFDDFKVITDRYAIADPELVDSTHVDLNRITIKFGQDKKVYSITTNW